jgi:hypothetical protein
MKCILSTCTADDEYAEGPNVVVIPITKYLVETLKLMREIVVFAKRMDASMHSLDKFYYAMTYGSLKCNNMTESVELRKGMPIIIDEFNSIDTSSLIVTEDGFCVASFMKHTNVRIASLTISFEQFEEWITN